MNDWFNLIDQKPMIEEHYCETCKKSVEHEAIARDLFALVFLFKCARCKAHRKVSTIG